MYTFILAFLTAFAVTYYAIPSIITIAREKNLTDQPGERRSHSIPTPSLGGIAIFAGVLFSLIAWTPYQLFEGLQYILCSAIVIFLIGAKDDIIPSRPMAKLLGQILAASILVFVAGVKIPSFFGVFGIEALPVWLSYIISIFTIIVIVNAFNLIDGVNGLTATICIITSFFLGYWFNLIDHPEFTILSAALIGSSVAFLKYNWTPAKIFMGDTGSLLIGLMLSVQTLKFLEFHHTGEVPEQYFFLASPAIAIAILIVPLFDTLRVFVSRILRGKSPFHPDRNHIHHLLIDSGLSHIQATMVLGIVTMVFIAFATSIQSIGILPLILIIGFTAFGLTWLLKRVALKRRAALSLQEKD